MYIIVALIMSPVLWIIGILLCLFKLWLAKNKREASYINLWLTAMMICAIALQAAIAYQQFQASQKPSVGIELKKVNFAKEGSEFKNFNNVDGNVPSKLLSPIVIIKNYGEKPAFIENVSIKFIKGKECLSLTDPTWNDFPVFPGHEADLRFDMPISIDDFNRIGFVNDDVQVALCLTYKPMSPWGYKCLLEFLYKYNATNEKIDLITCKYKEINFIGLLEQSGNNNTRMNWVYRNLDLILSIMGTLLIAFSFGQNLEGAYQTKKNLITRKEVKVYLASFLHPLWFKMGCVFLIIGFVITILKR